MMYIKNKLSLCNFNFINGLNFKTVIINVIFKNIISKTDKPYTFMYDGITVTMTF